MKRYFYPILLNGLIFYFGFNAITKPVQPTEIETVKQPVPIITIEEIGVNQSVAVTKYPKEEVKCLADNIYFEGRSETTAGQIAIGAVTLNRVKQKTFPNTICGVVKQTRYRHANGQPVKNKCQFSWYCDGKPDNPTERKAYIKATKIAEMLLTENNIVDPTNGADHYHADYVKPPVWTSKMVQVAVVDSHIFYKTQL